MSPAFRPLSTNAATEALADLLTRTPDTVRIAVDGPPCADPGAFAESLVEALRVRGRPAVHVRAATFWRDASLRLEFGHEDLESFRTWLDTDALTREVLLPIVTDGSYLPSLRDPDTNRSTREPARTADPGTVLLVSGAFLLGYGLPFERTVHLAVSAPARARRTPDPEAWTLPAYDDYDREVRPSEAADVVLKLDDPRHPAAAGL